MSYVGKYGVSSPGGGGGGGFNFRVVNSDETLSSWDLVIVFPGVTTLTFPDLANCADKDEIIIKYYGSVQTGVAAGAGTALEQPPTPDPNFINLAFHWIFVSGPDEWIIIDYYIGVTAA